LAGFPLHAPALGKTISAHFLRPWIYRERILKICPRRSNCRLAREYLLLSAMQKPNPAV